MSEEGSEDKLLDHNYDGIRECDNDLPGWWLVLFFATIVFSVCYVSYRSFLSGVTAPELLKAQLAALEVQASAGKGTVAAAEPTEEELLALLQSEEAVAAGHRVFLGRCAPCHGQFGEGNIGPNLTDKYWLHGGKLAQIRHTIARGVLEKGMLAWKGVLKDEEIGNVTVFIKSVNGSNPPNAKAPQGALEE